MACLQWLFGFSSDGFSSDGFSRAGFVVALRLFVSDGFLRAMAFAHWLFASDGFLRTGFLSLQWLLVWLLACNGSWFGSWLGFWLASGGSWFGSWLASGGSCFRWLLALLQWLLACERWLLKRWLLASSDGFKVVLCFKGMVLLKAMVCGVL